MVARAWGCFSVPGIDVGGDGGRGGGGGGGGAGVVPWLHYRIARALREKFPAGLDDRWERVMASVLCYRRRLFGFRRVPSMFREHARCKRRSRGVEGGDVGVLCFGNS